MIDRTKKPQLVNLSDITVDLSRNVRDSVNFDADYDIEPILADIAMRGQQDPVTLEQVGDKLYPLKGFRRITAKKTGVERGLHYDNESAPEGLRGKPLEPTIIAVVYKNLDERERTELLLDHGQRKGLSKVGLQNAFERAFNAGWTDKEIAVMLHSLLAFHYPPTRTIGKDLDKADPEYKKKMDQAIFEYYKGVLQVAKRVWKAPTVLRDAYYKKLRGEQSWPSNDEIKDLVSIHNKETDANQLLSRDNPGPEFSEKFKKLQEAKSTEKNAPRVQVTMRNRQQVTDSIKTLESPISKAFQKIHLGDFSVDKLATLDRILQTAWPNMPEADRNEVTGWFKTEKPEEAGK